MLQLRAPDGGEVEPLAAADLELDQDRRIEIYRESQVILLDEMPFAPLYYGRRNVLVKPYVQGIVPSARESEIPGDLSFAKVFISGRE